VGNAVLNTYVEVLPNAEYNVTTIDYPANMQTDAAAMDAVIAAVSSTFTEVTCARKTDETIGNVAAPQESVVGTNSNHHVVKKLLPRGMGQAATLATYRCRQRCFGRWSKPFLR